MLITKTVMVKWYGANRKWYESMGYTFTKMYDEFEVKVEDLSDGCNIKVIVKCDCEDCKNNNPYLKPMRWCNYKICLKENGLYYCNKCSKKLFGDMNRIKTLLSNGKSFEQWCCDNNRQDILELWDYELNNKNPDEITYGSRQKYYFKCPKGLHKSELKLIESITNLNTSISCTTCNSFAYHGIINIGDDFLEKYWDYNKNTINPWEISYGDCRKKIWINCQEKDYHESYAITCGNFLNKNARCPYCNRNSGKIHSKDSLGQLLEDKGLLYLWSDKNEKYPYEYAPNSTKKVYWKCPDGKHEDYLRGIKDSNIYEFRCSECTRERTESMLQEKTRLYLGELGYEILHEDKCTLKPRNIVSPPNNSSIKRNKGILKYDNEILININHHLFIEVMGQQHEIVGMKKWNKQILNKYNTTPQQELDYQIEKDKYKEQYVYDQGSNYHYLAVWYYDFDKTNTYKKLIDDKINEIIKQNTK